MRPCSLLIAALFASSSALADPCGMVPPINLDFPGETRDIQRTGLQQTYGFFQDGVETLVIRPGFTGNVEEFGMLVPFPSPPALRKIDDRTFTHLAAAVDPPDVQIHLYDDTPQPQMSRSSRAVTGAASAAPADEGMMLRRDEVRVVNEEAVGMYEVAVLEAGSPKALQRWMEDHQFRYPEGMEETIEDYVASRWVFVAIKAHVASAAGTSPFPGQRHVDTRLPAGTSFDGYVQGMGFRFEVDEPVIPMRLSGFNGDDTHNRVYFVSDTPVRISGIPKSTVRRQVAGEDLYSNVVDPLDLTIHNGKKSQISKAWWDQIDPLLDPAPHNGVAKDLMASDLLAVQSGELSLPFEEVEKEMLRISESLGLRGVEIDQLHAAELAEAREGALEDVVGDLRSMHLTLLDGEFPAELMADQNLDVRPWAMLPEKNTMASFSLQPAGPQLWVPYSRR